MGKAVVKKSVCLLKDHSSEREKMACFTKSQTLAAFQIRLYLYQKPKILFHANFIRTEIAFLLEFGRNSG